MVSYPPPPLVDAPAPESAAPLHTGQTIMCPNCGRVWPVHAWTPLGRPARYCRQLLPVYRCTVCRHIFAPLPPGLAPSV